MVGVREARKEGGGGFVTEDLVDGGVNGWGVERPEGHNDVAVFAKVRAVEGGFFLIWSINSDLVIARFGIKTDKK